MYKKILCVLVAITNFDLHSQKMTWYERELASNYEDRWQWNPDKRVAYQHDPYVWRYSKRFAENYGMPVKWISTGIVGADALAISFIDKNSQHCRLQDDGQVECKAAFECKMDLYIDKAINLPWLLKEQMQGISPLNWDSSIRAITSQFNRQISSFKVDFLSVQFSIDSTKEKVKVVPALVAKYDKQRLKNYSLVKLVGCDTFENYVGGTVNLDIFSADPRSETTEESAHKIIIDESVFKNLKDVFQKQYQEFAADNRQLIKLNYQDYVLSSNSPLSNTFEPKEADSRYDSAFEYSWVYNKQFANTFNLPNNALANDLVGVNAIAYRKIRDEYFMCGLGRAPTNCARFKNCQIDLYIDKGGDIPWLDPSQLQGFHALPDLSQYYLMPQILEELAKYNPNEEAFNGGVPRHSVYSIASEHGRSIASSFGAIVYHDRLSLDKYDVISIKGCYAIPSSKYLSKHQPLKLNFLPKPHNIHAPFLKVEGQVDWLKDIRYQIQIGAETIEQISRKVK
ncbi:hypothetical protein [Gayadomonas joobiniege]|uniref:hypothetical protein n=1 Tax=Gayadomonas joobiniege TaxID=1234606 RepID=UPI0012DD3471|nr:hypothetical protein [Gayadomonas joobiniege]